MWKQLTRWFQGPPMDVGVYRGNEEEFLIRLQSDVFDIILEREPSWDEAVQRAKQYVTNKQYIQMKVIQEKDIFLHLQWEQGERNIPMKSAKEAKRYKKAYQKLKIKGNE